MDGHHCLLHSMNYPQYNSFGNMSDQMTKNAPPTDPDPSLSSSNNLGFCFMSRFNRYAPFFISESQMTFKLKYITCNSAV